ncbi:MAG: O-antigen ligase family protein [Candidatus Magasanikbacteria bacterium]
MQKILERILKILIGTTFFIPLLVLPKVYIFPFIVPKIIYFRSLVLLMLGVYLILLFANFAKYRPRFSWLHVSVLAFFSSFLISTFLGVDWYKSFWDSHERMLGAFTIFHYIIYYIIVSSVLHSWDDWKNLLRTFLLAGSVVMFIGLLQRYADPEMLLNRGSERVSATLGNAIYFSGYGLFLFFVGALLAVKDKLKLVKNQMFSFEASWFWFEVLAALLGFWGIFLGGTRGALVAWLLAIIILSLVYFFTLKEQKKLKQIVSLFFLSMLTIFGVLFINRNTEFVQNLPTVGRLFSTDISNTNTRVMAWGVALDAWQEKPIFGWGPNNYYYAFNKYYRPEFLQYGFTETWFDNAHSVIMNTLAVQGVVGIVLYVSMFLLASWLLIKKYREGNLDVHILAFSLAFLWAHFISVATVFDNPTSYLYFFFFLAMVNFLTENKREENLTKNYKQISIGISVLVSVFILILLYSTNINPARANKATLRAIQNLTSGKAFEADYELALKTPSPHIDDIRNDISRFFTEVITQIFKDTKIKDKWAVAENFYNLAVNNLEENLKIHPNDIRVSLQLSQLKLIGASATQDVKLLQESEKILEDALLLSPKRQQIQYLLSNVKQQLQKPEEAEQLLRDSISNDPLIANGWQQLESLYKAMGENEKAKALHEEAVEKGISF